MIKSKKLMALIGIALMLNCEQILAHESHSHDTDNRETLHDISESLADNSSPTHTTPTPATSPKNDNIDMTKLSEAFGNFIGRNLHSPGLKFDMEALIKGIRDGVAGKPSPLTDKEYEEMMAAVQEKAFKEMSETNLKNANDYLNKNVKAEGVVEVVPGKLQYQIIKEGTGAVVEPHSSPQIHYTGKYQDGTVFGTSEEMGNPITIPLDQTIPGFSKGIVGMKEGEKRRLFVHPDLGYGTTGQLPPNEMLIFEVELVKANAEDDKTKAPESTSESKDEDESGDEDFADELNDDSDADTKE